MISIILCCGLLQSCAEDTEQYTDSVVHSANILLSSGLCDEALNVLDDPQVNSTTHAMYIQTLASAYACKASFSEITFFSDDIDKIGTPLPLGWMSTFTTSVTMDAPDNDSYDNLILAINTLLYAGGLSTAKDPTVARRAAIFDSDDADSINVQLIYYIMAAFGKYAYYYGNADAAGSKGVGAGANTCYYQYDNTIDITINVGAGDIPMKLDDFLDVSVAAVDVTGVCDKAANTGHFAYGVSTINRLCQGVVLLNNFKELAPEVMSIFPGDYFDSLQDVINGMDVGLDYLVSPDVSLIRAVQSQQKCELENASNLDDLQVFFALGVETVFL